MSGRGKCEKTVKKPWNKGITLIETVVSIGILSLLAVLLVSVIGVSSGVEGDNAGLKKSSMEAAAGVENIMSGFAHDAGMTSAVTASGVFGISFGGTVIEQAGDYVRCSDLDNKAVFMYFLPD